MKAHRVWKYELAVGQNEFFIPNSHRLLTVGVQANRIVLWVEIQPDTADGPVRFWVTGTGSPIPVPYTYYVGTVQVEGWVWHVFTDSHMTKDLA